ncbi:Aqualysin-1 OS=Thermus aquaticus GN=pstI PE=1 SV=2 [Rhizoctonia solani AG-1 IB]|uniref:Aqualysin-1 n=1 Tax=Thanatephorus cucumeris (strain AG1-IB / isolate 7/3/14) TaxID=1108050 RepID=A0A0B7FVR6_THACB|nr:Aqualysin-1 OS=Thermus aquaticus GN=pstI PE=1 SV=2 [Rhizoctonia solani AG-1 IB]
MFSKSLILLFSIVYSRVIAAPAGSWVPILKHPGKVQENSYIIQLKPEASKSIHLSRLASPGLTLRYSYDQVFHGYAAKLDSTGLEYVRRSSDVAAIFEDGIITTSAYEAPSKSDGLTPDPLSRFNPNLDDIRRATTAPVDVYDIGTGIYTAHTAFGGRVYWGATFGGYNNADGNGFSTCLAGIAVGATYGVTTQANIYAVKAMSDSGAAATSDMIAGINWVISSVNASGRPSVTMLGAAGPASTALDNAVVSATNKGIHFIVPAPTSNVGSTSPARVPPAVTVGVAGQSYTSGVDVCSNGTAVTCPSIQGPTATRTTTGSTPAMARVAGIVAAVIGTHGNSSPASIEAALKVHASNTNGCLVINNPW